MVSSWFLARLRPSPCKQRSRGIRDSASQCALDAKVMTQPDVSWCYAGIWHFRTAQNGLLHACTISLPSWFSAHPCSDMVLVLLEENHGTIQSLPACFGAAMERALPLCMPPSLRALDRTEAGARRPRPEHARGRVCQQPWVK